MKSNVWCPTYFFFLFTLNTELLTSDIPRWWCMCRPGKRCLTVFHLTVWPRYWPEEAFIRFAEWMRNARSPSRAHTWVGSHSWRSPYSLVFVAFCCDCSAWKEHGHRRRKLTLYSSCLQRPLWGRDCLHGRMSKRYGFSPLLLQIQCSLSSTHLCVEGSCSVWSIAMGILPSGFKRFIIIAMLSQQGGPRQEVDAEAESRSSGSVLLILPWAPS